MMIFLSERALSRSFNYCAVKIDQTEELVAKHMYLIFFLKVKGVDLF